MAIRESDLNTIQDIAVSDFARAVTNEGSSRKVTVANLAKTIIENYAGSNIGGSNQSIKDAFTALDSKTKLNVIELGSGDDLNTMYGNDKSGFYYITRNVANAPDTFLGLIVIAKTDITFQLAYRGNRIYIREYTGNSQSMNWSDWKSAASVEDQALYLTHSNAASYEAYNCEGDIGGSITFFKSKTGIITINARINIDNFVRTGNNPGVRFPLPDFVPTPTRSISPLVGFRSQNTREIAMLRLLAGSRTAEFVTSETYQNAPNGTLTIIASSTIIV